MTDLQSGAAGLLAAGLLAAVPPAFAGVRITPVVVEMPSTRQPGVVTVHNDSTLPRRIQAQGLHWLQEGGRDIFEPSEDLIVVPPLAEIPPGGSQLFRIGLRRPAGAPVERAYRLMLEDITASDGAGRSIAIRFAHNLPVLIAPAVAPIQLVRWAECTPPGLAAPRAGAAESARETCLRLMNAGNRRIKLQRLELTAGGQTRTLELPEGMNLLAGSSRELKVPMHAPIETLRVEAADAVEAKTERGGF